METNKEKKDSFFKKIGRGFANFFKGIGNFFVKTGRTNSSKNFGCIEGIGDFLVYDNHALISAVGMGDVTFTKENVISWRFEGLSRIRRKEATVKYTIKLDGNVIFPQKVREKNDVNNLTATIFVNKETERFISNGEITYGELFHGVYPLEKCDIYIYDDCFVIAVKLEKRNGNNVERYQESLLYPFSNIDSIIEEKERKFVVQFDDEKYISFTILNNYKYEKFKAMQRQFFIGSGEFTYKSINQECDSLEKCDIYMYANSFVIAVNLENRNGNNVEKHHANLLYKFSAVNSLDETTPKSFNVRFNDGNHMSFMILNNDKYEMFKIAKIVKIK